MKYLVSFTALLVLQAHAIDFVLFKGNTCDDFEDEGYLCQGYGYNQCCGMFGSGGVSYGAAAVGLGDTAAENTPVLRACNEGAGGGATPCDLIRAQATYTPNPDATFPCLEGPYGGEFNGFIVQSIVTAAKREEQQAPGYLYIAGSNGIGLVENGTIYGLKEASESFKSYEQKKDGMTREERRAFIIMHSELQSKVGHYFKG